MKTVSSHADALAQAKKLGKVSDDNLVHFFKPELKVIGAGGRATAILPIPVIQQFTRIGFLRLKGPEGYILTRKAAELLQENRE